MARRLIHLKGWCCHMELNKITNLSWEHLFIMELLLGPEICRVKPVVVFNNSVTDM